MEPNNSEVSYPKQKTLKQKDGTIIHYWGKVMHRHDGPAYIPQGDTKKAKYFLYGIEYTKDKFDDWKKSQEGLPFYKSSMKLEDGSRF